MFYTVQSRQVFCNYVICFLTQAIGQPVNLEVVKYDQDTLFQFLLAMSSILK